MKVIKTLPRVYVSDLDFAGQKYDSPSSGRFDSGICCWTYSIDNARSISKSFILSWISISEENLGEVDSIFINENFRRFGIGKELMNRSLEWFNENEINDIIILVTLGNEKALPFYEKFGFAPRTYILKKKPVI